MLPQPAKKTFCQNDTQSERQDCPLGSETLRQMQEYIRAAQEKLEDLQTTLDAQTALALAGYPLDKDGKPDIAGHRSYHEELIEQERAKTEYWRKMTFELTKYGLIGFILWVITQLWAAFIKGPIK